MEKAADRGPTSSEVHPVAPSTPPIPTRAGTAAPAPKSTPPRTGRGSPEERRRRHLLAGAFAVMLGGFVVLVLLIGEPVQEPAPSGETDTAASDIEAPSALTPAEIAPSSSPPSLIRLDPITLRSDDALASILDPSPAELAARMSLPGDEKLLKSTLLDPALSPSAVSPETPASTLPRSIERRAAARSAAPSAPEAPADSSLPPRQAPTPVARTTGRDISGAEIRRVVNGQERGVAACLAGSPTSAYRRVDLTLRVEPDGTVSAAQVDHPRLPLEDKECITRKARSWRFRAPGGEAAREIQLPFVIVAGGGS